METILLVEDSKFLRVATERILTKAGYQVICAGDGDEAIVLAGSRLPDLIVVDMLLPKLGGPEVLRSLKRNELTAHIPVVVLSSLSQNNGPKLVQEGADAFIEKGSLLADPGRLLAAVMAALPRIAVLRTADFVPRYLQNGPSEPFLFHDMPLAGDGFTLVSAMRHTHPEALTVVLSGDPALDEAIFAILHQADEIFAKPIRIGALKELIRTRLADPHSIKRMKPESVASILEREAETTIQNWLDVVELDAELTCIRLTRNDRTGHLPKLLRDLAVRLRVDSESPSPPSQVARDHGALRHQQGYTAAMVVEESRILQMSIFSTLQRNLSGVDFSRLLQDVVTIADEVDSQLKQAMFSYVTPMTSKSQTARLAG